MTPIVFPGGHTFVPLTETRGQWREPVTGAHVAYVMIENVTYFPTLGEQYLSQRGLQK